MNKHNKYAIDALLLSIGKVENTRHKYVTADPSGLMPVAKSWMRSMIPHHICNADNWEIISNILTRARVIMSHSRSFNAKKRAELLKELGTCTVEDGTINLIKISDEIMNNPELLSTKMVTNISMIDHEMDAAMANTVDIKLVDLSPNLKKKESVERVDTSEGTIRDGLIKKLARREVAIESMTESIEEYGNKKVELRNKIDEMSKEAKGYETSIKNMSSIISSYRNTIERMHEEMEDIKNEIRFIDGD